MMVWLIRDLDLQVRGFEISLQDALISLLTILIPALGTIDAD